jgi:polyphosphate kinase
MKKNTVLINKELSWLSFNERVLQEARDKSVPLIERIKFLGIFSNNRDEFFRIRVAGIKRMIKYPQKAAEVLGENPVLLLDKIQQQVIAQQNLFDKTYTEITKELVKEGIYIINEKQLSQRQGEFVKQYFREKVLPCLVPIMLESTPKFPYLKDKSSYLLVKLTHTTKKSKYALLELPTGEVSRFLVISSSTNKKYIILLDDVIRYCLEDIFSLLDYKASESYTIKLTRDAELDLDNDVSKSFIEKMSKSLKKRSKGQPVRLVYDSRIAPDMLRFVTRSIKLRKSDNLIPGGRYHNFKDFMNFPVLDKRDLQYKPLPPLYHPDLSLRKSTFDAIKNKDILLVYPYNAYSHILDFLREASIDPKVQSIMITLYRVAKGSNVVNTLINAVKNGKQVTVVLELQARFDEENNIYWANKLSEEGATVIYGVPGLKVHSKVLLISRKEGNKLALYSHVGTGNFNEQTSKVYSDISLLTCDERITQDIQNLFHFYHDNYKIGTYSHSAVSPFNMRKKFTDLIDREIKNAKKGLPAYIIIKLNNLVDAQMINKLYEASKHNVKVQLIVRGMCSLLPGVKGLSENIEAVSIVDKYLEHSRVLIFCNNNDEKYFISSADWMSRNLDHRSEIAIPVYDKSLQVIIKKMIDLQLIDNCKARIINDKQDNVFKTTTDSKPIKAQDGFYEYLRLQYTRGGRKKLS